MHFVGVNVRQFLIPESENQGVCVSLAYCPRTDDIVASFRPKVEIAGDLDISQPLLTPSASSVGQGVQGFHVLYRRLGNNCYQKLGSTCANLDVVRLQKSAIVDRNNHRSFVFGDEVTHELLLQDLPSLMVAQRLKSWKHPLRDVKYNHVLNSGLLICLGDDVLQLFYDKLL
ncbi:unnamed protein product [Ilex paraguariensis]|uniref:Uncharacterized protein n=1 Tax=Ilex paraguariensis TaxID=185542 RepID=A0ABC8U7I5_9AQUA